MNGHLYVSPRGGQEQPLDELGIMLAARTIASHLAGKLELINLYDEHGYKAGKLATEKLADSGIKLEASVFLNESGFESDCAQAVELMKDGTSVWFLLRAKDIPTIGNLLAQKMGIQEPWHLYPIMGGNVGIFDLHKKTAVKK